MKSTFNNQVSENWMQFQQSFTPDETFKSTFQVDMPNIEERTEKHKFKGNSLTNNEQAMKEYRERWTTGNHVFPRTYQGAEKC